MTETIYCPAQTYSATRDSPAEYCTNEVPDYGDLCDAHDTDARTQDSYDRYMQSKED